MRVYSFIVSGLISALIGLSCASTSFAGDLKENLKILIVSPEQNEIFQTGGLAHATTGLAQAFNNSGIQADVLMPYYYDLHPKAHPSETGAELVVPLDWKDGVAQKSVRFHMYQQEHKGTQTFFLKHEPQWQAGNYFYNPRQAGQAKYYTPNDVMGEAFGAFARAASQFILQNNYDLVILKDWTTGLIAAELKDAKEAGIQVPKTIFIIHNIAFQGIFPKDLHRFLGLPNHHLRTDGGYEYYDQVSFLKSGLQYSDHVSTVSPRYAEEITTKTFGMGMEGLVRSKLNEFRLTGILNGINESAWDPAQPETSEVPYPFSVQDLRGKAKGKSKTQEQFNLPKKANVPLFVLTSRVAEQKGFEYLIGAIDEVARTTPAQFILAGDGDPNYIRRLEDLQARFPTKVRYEAFSPELEKQLMAYADFFINAAWFEPCGLNQFFALKNGTLPLVSQVGGLVDSVVHGKTGWLFPIVPGEGGHYDTLATQQEVVQAIRNAVQTFKKNPSQLHEMKLRAMKGHYSWGQRLTSEYLPLVKYVLSDGSDKLQKLTYQPTSKNPLAPSLLWDIANEKVNVGVATPCENLLDDPSQDDSK